MAVVIIGLPPFVGWLTSLNMQQVGRDVNKPQKPQMESGRANSEKKTKQPHGVDQRGKTGSKETSSPASILGRLK